MKGSVAICDREQMDGKRIGLLNWASDGSVMGAVLSVGAAGIGGKCGSVW